MFLLFLSSFRFVWFGFFFLHKCACTQYIKLLRKYDWIDVTQPNYIWIVHEKFQKENENEAELLACAHAL